MKLKPSKSSIVAFYSALAAGFRVLSGPVSILIVSALLTADELGFYYTFWSFLAMTMLFEVGVGFVLKQFYSYEFKDSDLAGETEPRSVNHIFYFSIQWYAIATILYVLLVGYGGFIYFSSYTGSIDWRLPFVMLIFAAGLRVFITVFDSFVDGIQYQELINMIRLVSTLFSVIVLWTAIYFKLSLYSIALSQFAYVASTIFFIWLNKGKIFSLIDFKFKSSYSFRKQFSMIFPLLGRTSLVWFFGYFFWNSFTLIAFKIFGAEQAGRVGLSVSIARGGFDVALSFLINQRTLFANQIANGRAKEALKLFKRYFVISFVTIVTGYTAFIVLGRLVPDFYVFEKLVSEANLITLLLFFVLTLVMTALNNFVRAYKIEPFVMLSLYNALSIPALFLFSSINNFENLFMLSVVALSLSVCVSIRYFYLRVT